MQEDSFEPKEIGLGECMCFATSVYPPAFLDIVFKIPKIFYIPS